MKKVVVDNLVLLASFWISIPLAILEGSYLLSQATGSWLVVGFLTLFVLNCAGLMWLWRRLSGSLAPRKRDAHDN